MKFIIYIIIFINLLFFSSTSMALENDKVQINLGARYEKIERMLDKPIEEVRGKGLWSKRALYKISDSQYCIIDYFLNRAKSILFLEQVSEEDALKKFNIN